MFGYRLSLLVVSLGVQLGFASFLPDTGLSVHASGSNAAGNQRLQVRLQNLSRTTRSRLELRIFLTGDSVDFTDFTFRADLLSKYAATGFASMPTPRIDTMARLARAKPSTPGCTSNCQMAITLPLTDLALDPLESFRIDLVPEKHLPDGTLAGTPPTHSISTADWSLSGIPLDSAKEPEDMARGDGPLARHIQILSEGDVVWGNAPGEPDKIFPSPWKRQGLSTTIDAIKTPFPDSASQRTRDGANMKLSRIVVNQAGYREVDVRADRAWIQAIGPTQAAFSVIDRAGAVVGRGALVSKSKDVGGQIRAKGSNWTGTSQLGDFAYDLISPSRSGILHEGRIPSNLPAGGPYRIVDGNDTSAGFRVDDRIYGWLRDAELRFFGAQRSGNSESWLHGPSHLRDVAPGGWYDCGNHIKEGTTQAYALAVLGSMATSFPERDADRTGYNHDSTRVTDGVPDLLRELKHGADYVVESWIRSGRSISGTITTVGNPGYDLNGWFPADWVDILPTIRGGQPSRTGFVDTGASVRASFAAGLAFFSKAWKSRDAGVADEALDLAKSLYAVAKADPKKLGSSGSYTSAAESYGALALAAVALLAATGETTYLDDLVHDRSLGSLAYGDSTRFPAGWLNHLGDRSPTLDYADLDALALFQFHQLVLRDSSLASALGVKTEKERLALETRTGMTLRSLLGNLHGSTEFSGAISLPTSPNLLPKTVSYDPLWFSLPQPIGVSNWWNEYQVGSIAALFLYSKLASDLQGRKLPFLVDSTDWKSSAVGQLALRSMDGLLGVNPWDLSLIHGIGAKNPNHPHHRTSNPDGRDLPFPYIYQPPVGAVHPGISPSTSLLQDAFSSATTAEACLESSASLLIPALILSIEQDPASSIRMPGFEPAGAAVFSAKSSRRGVKIEWSAATGSVEALLTDGSGRRIGQFESNATSGTTEIVIHRGPGPTFARVRDDRNVRSFVIPGL